MGGHGLRGLRGQDQVKKSINLTSEAERYQRRRTVLADDGWALDLMTVLQRVAVVDRSLDLLSSNPDGARFDRLRFTADLCRLREGWFLRGPEERGSNVHDLDRFIRIRVTITTLMC